MKIAGFNNIFRLPEAVSAQKNEGEGGSGRNQYDPNQTRKDDPQKDSEKKRADQELDPQVVDQALASFQADSTMQSSGLSAVVEGTGPGLRIAVKDVNGTILREFSGEEFLKMRDSKTKGSPNRGKILDQKL
ncbi:hypothetical protein WDW37_14540 [Bdellovibrionota bacterium FG-1]